jgi:hypothetical protein
MSERSFFAGKVMKGFRIQGSEFRIDVEQLLILNPERRTLNPNRSAVFVRRA